MDWNDIAKAILTGAVPVVIALWAWFKAHAAQTDAKWDDAFVAFITNVAKGAVADAQKGIVR